MKWKTFSQIVLLMIIGAIIFYIVCPKYAFHPVTARFKINEVTGKVLYHNSGTKKWEVE